MFKHLIYCFKNILNNKLNGTKNIYAYGENIHANNIT